jgi:bifunctional UDP-N-acetylglucosamine pyrophosphorylase/glucosamine-1-phosphate N-acetyltransferase
MSAPRPFKAVILAAGLGTRMKSSLPKVLHEVLGRPMVTWAVDSALAAGAEQVVVITGHGREQVESELSRRYANAPVTTRVQHQMLGTADAVRSALDTFADYGGDVLIMNGDTPNLRRREVEELLAHHRQHDGVLTLLSAIDPDEHRYGRIIRNPNGTVARIVEYKDALTHEPALLDVREVNIGLYAVRASFLVDSLGKITPGNAAGEYYLTDIVGLSVEAGSPAHVVCAESIHGLHGVNDREQLAEANEVARARRNAKLLQGGVTLVDPRTTWVEGPVWVESDVVLEPCVMLVGSTWIGRDVRIGAHSRLEDCRVAPGTFVEPGTIARGRELP